MYMAMSGLCNNLVFTYMKIGNIIDYKKNCISNFCASEIQDNL